MGVRFVPESEYVLVYWNQALEKADDALESGHSGQNADSGLLPPTDGSTLRPQSQVGPPERFRLNN